MMAVVVHDEKAEKRMNGGWVCPIESVRQEEFENLKNVEEYLIRK